MIRLLCQFSLTLAHFSLLNDKTVASPRVFSFVYGGHFSSYFLKFKIFVFEIRIFDLQFTKPISLGRASFHCVSVSLLFCVSALWCLSVLPVLRRFAEFCVHKKSSRTERGSTGGVRSQRRQIATTGRWSWCCLDTRLGSRLCQMPLNRSDRASSSVVSVNKKAIDSVESEISSFEEKALNSLIDEKISMMRVKRNSDKRFERAFLAFQ